MWFNNGKLLTQKNLEAQLKKMKNENEAKAADIVFMMREREERKKVDERLMNEVCYFTDVRLVNLPKRIICSHSEPSRCPSQRIWVSPSRDPSFLL